MILGVDIAKLFIVLNNRIELLFDRDHLLGHSYFLVNSLEELRDVFVSRIIPLLQEYFYNDWEKVCLVLGCRSDATHRNSDFSYPIMLPTLLTSALFPFSDSDSIEDRIRWDINKEFRYASADQLCHFFKAIYGDNPHGELSSGRAE